MRFIADFHIHSHFSISTSKQLTPEYLDYWARLKGIRLLGTGDCTHAGWLEELQLKLEPAEAGLFRLRHDQKISHDSFEGKAFQEETRFILSGEISCIYKWENRVRKVHHVIILPDMQSAWKFRRRLSRIGNVDSDGRPILGLDSRDLLEMLLSTNDRAFLIPAHIWTPWFSVLGSRSGFESIEECYRDLSSYIHSVEMGLSSNQDMNQLCSMLDGYTLLANSDAHSPEKLGRNANILDTQMSYEAVKDAIEKGANRGFIGTISFFPQEGKYHFDGHRNCRICWDPLSTVKKKGICTECGKPVTLGVMHRVAQLADRAADGHLPKRPPSFAIIPLKELLAEINGVGAASKKVNNTYHELLDKLGPELHILLDCPLQKIIRDHSAVLAEAIKRMRSGEVIISPGYDGTFGKITVFREGEAKSFGKQDYLFEMWDTSYPQKATMIPFDVSEFKSISETVTQELSETKSYKKEEVKINHRFSLNVSQKKAVRHWQGPAVVLAGPGSGKTAVLSERIAWLIKHQGVKPEAILAVTFTNNAVQELSHRMQRKLGDKADSLTVATFHSLGRMLICKYPQKFKLRKDFTIVDSRDRRLLITQLLSDYPQIKDTPKAIADKISAFKQTMGTPDDAFSEPILPIYYRYQMLLEQNNCCDIDDLVRLPATLLTNQTPLNGKVECNYQWILIDEYQDINETQYALIRALLPSNNIFAIGDPDQAIYGFRGADVRFISRFTTDFPNAEVYVLRRSYRCPEPILRCAQSVLDRRKSRSTPQLKGTVQGVPVRIVHTPTQGVEAEFIARTIEKMIGGLRSFSMDSGISAGERWEYISSLSDFAILCRIKELFEPIAHALDDHKIPYRIHGEKPFYEMQPYSDIIDVLKMVAWPQSIIAKHRSQKFMGLSEKSMQAIVDAQNDNSIVTTLRNVTTTFIPNPTIDQQENIDWLLNTARNFNSDLQAFLVFLGSGNSQDNFAPTSEQVSLMTLHASKGLEFQCVFIPGCEEGLFPYTKKNKRPDRDEEKRLFYVGMTRAKQYLYLTRAKKRKLHYHWESLPPSSFLKKMPASLVSREKISLPQKKELLLTPSPKQLSIFDLLPLE